MKSFAKSFAALGVALMVASTAVHADDKEHHRYHHGHGKFEFALIGDTPYKVAPGQEYAKLDRLVDEVNSDRKVRWVLHAGDIKSGSSFCSDELFMDRLYRFNQFNKPFIYTPGDNEWTDCHRIKAGEYQPLERLARLREIFFAEPGKTIGGRVMDVDSQAQVPGYEEFPENVMWTERGVVFATLHVVGSKNGWAAFDPNSSAQRSAEDDAEVARREAAVIAWIDRAFDMAMENDAPGVFLMMQANPGLEFRMEGVSRSGFEAILTALEEKTVAFGKPVVLAHGDSHYFRVDKPSLMANSFLGNFTRVETFGSANVHWVRVSVDPKDPEVFSFQQEVIEENL